jgi:hypothetical protein
MLSGDTHKSNDRIADILVCEGQHCQAFVVSLSVIQSILVRQKELCKSISGKAMSVEQTLSFGSCQSVVLATKRVSRTCRGLIPPCP